MSVTIEASHDLNPDNDERPSPVKLRIRERGSCGGGVSSDFFLLWDLAKEAPHQEISVDPGATEHLEWKLQPETYCLEVIAAFRNYEIADWLDEIEVEPIKTFRKTTRLTIKLDRLAVSFGSD